MINKKLVSAMMLTSSLISAGSVMAATDNDSVVVTGTVQEVMTVAIAGGTPSFNITPEVAIVDQDLGTITINSNDPDGYDVTLSSLRLASSLQNTAADETIVYTVEYNSAAAVSLSSDPLPVESVTTQTAGEVERSLTLNIAGPASKGRSAEAFTDTVTVTITGKA